MLGHGVDIYIFFFLRISKALKRSKEPSSRIQDQSRWKEGSFASAQACRYPICKGVSCSKEKPSPRRVLYGIGFAADNFAGNPTSGDDYDG